MQPDGCVAERAFCCLGFLPPPSQQAAAFEEAGCRCCLRRCFPGAWQVHFVWPNGRGALPTGIEKECPSYESLLNVCVACAGTSPGRGRCTLSGPTAGAHCRRASRRSAPATSAC